MDVVWSELGWDNFDWAVSFRLVMRLVAAGVLCGAIGWERARSGHPAGMRTHILVGLGSAVFATVAILHQQATGYAESVKGIAAGIGFLGAGAILKDVQKQMVEGLTTAATIWLTAAIGVAAAAGMYSAALASTVIALIVLVPLRTLEPPQERDHH